MPATFQSYMSKVFSKQIRDYVLISFDDILVYSPDLSSHLENLRRVLQILKKNQLYAKISKFCFAEKQVEYLGHIILGERVQADHEKIEDMKNWPVPRSVKQLRGFLGLTGFYRRFVKDYGVISEPLMALLKKDGFKWNEEAEKAFNKMKETMSEPQYLLLQILLRYLLLKQMHVMVE